MHQMQFLSIPMGFRIRVQRMWKIKFGKLLWSFRKRPNSRFPTYFWTNPGVVPPFQAFRLRV